MRSVKDTNAHINTEVPTDIVVASETALAELGALAERAGTYAEASQSKNTRKAYGKALRGFARWCLALGVPTQSDSLPALPAAPEALAAYIVARADQGGAVSSIALFLSAMADAHKQARLPSPLSDPALQKVWAGIKRSQGKPPRKAYPLSVPELRMMILSQRWGAKAIRDRCAMLLGFAGAPRPEELVAVELEHMEVLENGRLLLTIPHSKGDQESQGQSVIVARGSDRVTCPIAALEDWLAASEIVSGPIFRGLPYGRLSEAKLWPGDISKLLKSAARRAGFPKATVEKISGYSLRRGLATTARKQGRSLDSIQRQCRHRNIGTTMGYIAAEELARSECAAEGIGL